EVFCRRPMRTWTGHKNDVLELAWSKNNFLLSSSMDKTVKLWHVTRDECLYTFKHSDFVTSVAFHPKDERLFLSGSMDGKLRLWSIPEKRVKYWQEIPNNEVCTAVGFTADGRMCAVGSYSGNCVFYRVSSGLKYHTQILVKSRGKGGRAKKITGIQAMPGLAPGEDKASGMLITSNDSRIRLYNLRDMSL
ncbi:WD40-repeat-containing domain protein, partial [Syncephalis pseudoplumigaleata]